MSFHRLIAGAGIAAVTAATLVVGSAPATALERLTASPIVTPISSLVAVKRTMLAPLREGIAAARERENAAFAELMGGPANLEALAAFAEGREPDFTGL